VRTHLCIDNSPRFDFGGGRKLRIQGLSPPSDSTLCHHRRGVLKILGGFLHPHLEIPDYEVLGIRENISKPRSWVPKSKS
jgi:hypothetical protein